MGQWHHPEGVPCQAFSSREEPGPKPGRSVLGVNRGNVLNSSQIVDLCLKFILVREIRLEEEGKRPALSQCGKSKIATVVME